MSAESSIRFIFSLHSGVPGKNFETRIGFDGNNLAPQKARFKRFWRPYRFLYRRARKPGDTKSDIKMGRLGSKMGYHG
jgi:hypothetical protein